MVADPDCDDLDFQGAEVNEAVKTNKEAESVEEFEAVEEVEAVEEIETVEAEDAGEPEFMPGEKHQRDDDTVTKKNQLMLLESADSNRKLDLHVRKEKEAFVLLRKKVLLGLGVLIVGLIGVLVFVAIFVRIMPSSVVQPQEASIALPSTVLPVVISASPAEVFPGPLLMATAAVPQSVYKEPIVIAAPPVAYREPIEVAPAVNVAAPITYREPIQVAPAVNVAAPITYREPIQVAPAVNTAPAQASYTPDPLTAVDTMLVDMLQPVEPVTLSQPAPQSATRVEPQSLFIPMDTGIAPIVNVEAFTVPDIPREPSIQAAPSGRATSYQVQWGDTFIQIARDQNIGVGRLAAINGITPPFSLRVGQIIKFDGPVVPPITVSAPIISKVVTGPESNYRIFATTSSSVWVLDGEDRGVEARVGEVLGACGVVISLGVNFDRIKTTICSDIL